MRAIVALALAGALASWPVAASAEGERCGAWPTWPHDEFPDVDSTNRIAVAGSEVQLNGEPLDPALLTRRLRRDGRAPRPPVTILFLGMDVDCALVDRLRALIAETMPCGRGLCIEIHDQPVMPRARADGPLIDPVEEAVADLLAAAEALEQEAEALAHAAEEAAREMEEAADPKR
jgi:hypothetical protein